VTEFVVWPRVFLGGAPKCGTTALHGALEASGAFDLLWRKELFVLNDPGFWMPPPKGGFASLGPSCYEALGIDPGTVFVDGTSTYLYQATAPDALERAQRAGVRFVVVFVLRDPMERIVSNYRYFRFILGHDMGAGSLDEYVTRLLAGDLNTGNDQVDDALAHSGYAGYLGDWMTHLKDDRLLVLDSDAVRADLTVAARTVLDRAGLLEEPRSRKRRSARGNQSYVPRWPWLHRGALWLGSIVPHGALRRAGSAAYHRIMGSVARAETDQLGTVPGGALREALAPGVHDLVSMMPETASWGWVGRYIGGRPNPPQRT